MELLFDKGSPFLAFVLAFGVATFEGRFFELAPLPLSRSEKPGGPPSASSPPTEGALARFFEAASSAPFPEAALPFGPEEDEPSEEAEEESLLPNATDHQY